MKILLASGSPRRQSLLKSFGFEVEVIKPVFDEDAVLEKDPEKLVLALAEGKLESVARGDMPTLAADTVVAIGGKILGKPKDYDEAFNMLSELSGNMHTVYTGVCISKGDKKVLFCEKSDVYFHRLSDTQINAYIETGSPFDKAGSYGLQDDMGITFIEKVEGEISNVIGLPMGKTLEQIERINK